MRTEFYSLGEISDKELKYSVICTLYKGKWLWVRNRNRDNWELPGGHREKMRI